MTKYIHPNDNAANQVNANKGTTGTNSQYDHAHGNRGKQLNPTYQGNEQLAEEEEYMEMYGPLDGGDGD